METSDILNDGVFIDETDNTLIDSVTLWGNLEPMFPLCEFYEKSNEEHSTAANQWIRVKPWLLVSVLESSGIGNTNAIKTLHPFVMLLRTICDGVSTRFVRAGYAPVDFVDIVRRHGVGCFKCFQQDGKTV